MPGNAVIRIRRDTAANWTAANPVLALGELAAETDTLKLKLGDGATAWNALGYTTAAAVASGLLSASGYTQPTGTVVYRKTAGTGAVETQTLATLKTDLGLTGTNSGDQTITLTGDATGSGTGSFAVTVGKINGVALSGLATGILKNTTTTGVPSIAVAADFPTLNQNTTGSAATLTTSRNFSISGGGITASAVGFNGSANVTLSASVDAGHITLARMAPVATGTVFYRKTASTGDPEVQTLATLKTDLGLSGTNSGDQTSIVGITGTLAQFNTAITDANIPQASTDLTDSASLYKSGGTDVALADGGTGASLTDPNADSILFWDDSTGVVTWLSLGTNLSITGTTLNATGGGGLTDADYGDVVVSSGGTAMTVESAAGNFVVGGSLVNITGNSSSTATIRHTGAAGSFLALENTGGTYGTSRLTLGNENGMNGATFETTDGTITLVDFLFKTAAATNGTGGLRFERRTASLISNLNSVWELEFYNNSNLAAAPLVVGDGGVDARDLLRTTASATGKAGFRIPHGTAPTSPVDGDVWTTTSGMYVRINGATIGPFGNTTNALTMNNGGSGDASGTTFNGSAARTLSYNTIGAAPLASPSFTGTVQATGGSLYINGVSVPKLTIKSNTTGNNAGGAVEILDSTNAQLGFFGNTSTSNNDMLLSSAAALTIDAVTGVSIQFNGTTKLATTSAGASLSGKLALGSYTNSSPADGEIWFDGTNLKKREGGVTSNLDTTGGGGGAALTMNNSGSGVASGTTYDGSVARTISYNTLGAAPLASPTFTGLVTTAASASGGAGLNLPHGVAPTSPNNGDVWTTTSGVFWRINGGTVQVATGGGTATGTNTGDQTITLTGDVTGSGTGSFAATLATVNSNTGSFGSATAIPVITFDGKGRATAVSTATNTGGWTEKTLTSDYTGTTSFVDITDGTNTFTYTPPASSYFEIQAVLMIATSVATNLPRIGVHVAAQGAGGYGCCQIDQTGATTAARVTIDGTWTTTAVDVQQAAGGLPTASSPYMCYVTVRGRTGLSPAAISIQMASETTPANNCSVKAGSQMRYKAT